MNREQMIAWLTLEGWEPGIYTAAGEEARGPNNYFVRNRAYSGGYCLDIFRPIREYEPPYDDILVCHSSGDWFTPSEKPGTWDPFSEAHLKQILEDIG